MSLQREAMMRGNDCGAPVNIVNAAFILYYYSIETKKKIHQPSMLVQHLDVLKEIRSIRKDEDKSTENYS